MKFSGFARGLAAATMIAGASLAWQARAASPAITAAVGDPSRSGADKALDAERKPVEILSFIHLRPGETIVDVIPGAYWDRLFSHVVGPTGHVYAYIPVEGAKAMHKQIPPDGFALYPGLANVTTVATPINDFKVPTRPDIVWIRQNYHDLYDPFMGPANVPAFDKAVFDALKPGGYFVVIDHSAPAGSGIADTDTLHRIDAAVVKRDLKAAGFVFVGESDALRNPADTRMLKVFDPAIRGHTDQFVYLFRKP